jgi:hypothetical protein
MFRPRYGSLGFVALPSIWLFQLVLPLVSPLAELAMLLALFSGHWPIVLAYGSLLFAAELLGALVSYRLEGVWSVDLLLLFVQRVFYRQLLLYVSAKAIVSAIRGRRIAWHKLDRAGSWPRLPLAPPVGVADA